MSALLTPVGDVSYPFSRPGIMAALRDKGDP